MLSGCPILGLVETVIRYTIWMCRQVGKSDAIYEGQFKCGVKDGFGVLTATSGYKYEGQFMNNIMSGAGTFSRQPPDSLLEHKGQKWRVRYATMHHTVMHASHEHAMHQVSSHIQGAMSSPKSLQNLKVYSRGGRMGRAFTPSAMGLRHDAHLQGIFSGPYRRGSILFCSKPSSSIVICANSVCTRIMAFIMGHRR